MSSASARAQEPSMEEILASIRRIISDDQDVKPEAKAADPEPARGAKARAPEPTRPADPAPPPAAIPSAVADAPTPAPIEAREAPLARAQPEPDDEDRADEPAPRAAEAGGPDRSRPATRPTTEPRPPVSADAPPRRADSVAPRSAAPVAPAAKPVEELRSGDAPVGSSDLDLSHLDVALPEIMFSDGDDRLAPLPPGPARPLGRMGVEALISQEATASVGDAFNLLSHTILSNNARTLEDLVQDLLKPMLKGWLDDNLPSLVERLVRAEIERVARGR